MECQQNWLGIDGAQCLAEALKTNITLKKLNLRCNTLCGQGAMFLSEALKVNKGLTLLDLGFNYIGIQGSRYLSEALRVNSVLSGLNLRAFNGINDEGAALFAEALKFNKNSSLTDLDLRDNEINTDNECVQFIMQHLVYNTNRSRILQLLCCMEC